jgi:hypothetical protein
MNTKQAVAVIGILAPPLLICIGIYCGLKWLFSDETKPEPVPANAGGQGVATPNTAPASGSTAHVVAALAAAYPSAAAATPKLSTPVPIPAVATDIPQQVQPLKGATITRVEMARIFNRGARALTRTAAVAALTSLGFGKTAAYEALSPDGRFASWLQCAPNGTITWTG